MITLTIILVLIFIIILVLIFIPPARRIIFGILSAVFGALGIVFLVTRNPPTDRRSL